MCILVLMIIPSEKFTQTIDSEGELPNLIDNLPTIMALMDLDPESPLMHIPNDTAKKCRILTEFTFGQDHAYKLADALEMSAQTRAADQLRQFNSAETPWLNSYEVYMNVTPAQTLRSGGSHLYQMDARPRGVAIIFVTNTDLYNEAERFRSIFEQLLFDSVVHVQLTRDQIMDRLSEVSDSPEKYHGDAFVMMFIGPGYNENIIGWSAQPQWPPASADVMPISDIMDMFSETRCSRLRLKLKLFIFNCCRQKFSDATSVPTTTTAPNLNMRCSKCFGQLPCSKHESAQSDTMVSLMSTWKKGWYQEFPGTPIGHVSEFGQAFSHTIAQYSWYKNLNQLFVINVKRMEENLARMGESERRPEINIFAGDRGIYFNPGLWKE
ncbi:unnamed protein product [Medioppia subpectinata]|uniref:Caspase family p20 domain-containing protein n=1 Tax=Medioppia subpectinata TaxID=1979941 RepID=A0A7R9KCG8_9ACAR|nr:unnamed protein product [Medioppia subpectinata]CAG2100953.1 unnamed protein product [Medioppia subpectinata]